LHHPSLRKKEIPGPDYTSSHLPTVADVRVVH
jgi:hypothetical protein